MPIFLRTASAATGIPRPLQFDQLLSADTTDDSKPYPFYLAYAIETDVHELGDPNEWQAEWKWDGIRGQIIKRNNNLFVWSRGEELMTDKFPEFHSLNASITGWHRAGW